MIKPVLDNILIKPILHQDLMTKSGIVIPNANNNTDNKPNTGEVIEVGEKVQTIKQGDTVIFYKYAPTEVEIEGEVYYLLREEEIMGIIK